MSEEVQEGEQSTRRNSQVPQQLEESSTTDDRSNIPLMSLPRVVLTRVDVSNYPVPVATERNVAVGVLKKKSIARPKMVGKKKGRPRKSDTTNLKTKTTKEEVVSPIKTPRISLGKKSVKRMLSETAIKNKNSASEKKQKKVAMKKPKQSPFKNVKVPKPKKITNTIAQYVDTSEDEFLYDELIEDLENSNTSKAGRTPVSTVVKKKTNKIICNESFGNKAPTIERGGIVKRTKLPSEQKSISSSITKTSNAPKRIIGTVSTQSPTKRTTPISMHMSTIAKKDNNHNEDSSGSHTLSLFKPPCPLKPRIGPKQTLKVGPLFNSTVEDNDSDEYSEIETLDNELGNINFTKSIESKANKSTDKNIPAKSTLASSLKNNDDPNIDLIKILSDDTYVPVQNESCPDSKMRVEPGNVQPEKSENKSIEDSPPVRTIYELMNDISLQHPSWNLHILPETNAFCIAQVTKGRLGIPTMKKCIELDSYEYYGKVYIHQYHIKKYDGVYDSEKSILDLFNEIDSVKA